MSKKMIANAISAVLALGISSTATTSIAESSNQAMQNALAPKGMEKCFGVAKKGMNDCGSALHTCSGEAKIDRDPTEWLYMPTGLCKRIAGGSTTPPKS